ncbi:uncharacterized protein LOC111078229 isoform X1 [Drosophila obscura]|uniref:uncharacterized protein LOC111078229 isoform X1 n=1 Tax=Drosophila obscura TaxID=7282 RepID=UPI001BB26FBA|nr:uncharacterized protein LOC111078229 isoform X1 [Drosophila obscura]
MCNVYKNGGVSRQQRLWRRTFLNDPSPIQRPTCDTQKWRRQLKLFTSIQSFQYKPNGCRCHIQNGSRAMDTALRGTVNDHCHETTRNNKNNNSSSSSSSQQKQKRKAHKKEGELG